MSNWGIDMNSGRVTPQEAAKKAVKTPVVGDIVWYRPEQPLLDPQAAIVTRTMANKIVNLRVIGDDGEFLSWRVNVELGTEPGQWCWPLRL